jgi:DNA repair exonuclease SbcCD ATPase subunit
MAKSDDIDYSQYGARSSDIDYSKYGGSASSKSSAKPKNMEDFMRRLTIGKSPGEKVFDAATTMGGDVLTSAGNAVSQAYDYGPEAMGEIVKHPIRSTGSGLYGGTKLFENILNLPRNTPKILSHLGVAEPEGMELLNKILPRFDFAKYAKPSTKQNHGQELITNAVENLPQLLGAGKLLTMGGKAAVGSVSRGNPVMRAQIPLIEKSISGKEATLEDLANQHQEQLEKHKAAKYAAEEETGRSNPSTMKFAATNKQQGLQDKQSKIQELDKQHEDLNKKIDELSKLPELPNIDTASHEINVGNAKKSLEESNQHIQESEKTHESAKRGLNEIDTSIGQHLNRGTDHDVRAASQILNAQEGPLNPNGRRTGGIKGQISNVYNNLTQRFRDQNVNIDNTAEMRNTTNRLNELTRNGEFNGEEAQNLLRQLEQLNTEHGGQIPADQYLTALRSARDYAREARSNAFTPDMNAEARADWHRRFNELDEVVERMNGHLERAIGAEDHQLLQNANRAWRTQVIPLQRNTTYQTIRHRGRIEGDIMDKLRGTDAGDVLMRRIIQSDPEILKNVVGQRYAHNPAALREAGARENEYINRMPELRDMISRRQEASNIVDRTKENIKHAKKRKNEIISEKNKAVSSKNEAVRKAKKVNTEKKQREDEKQKLEAGQKDIKSQIDKHKSDISEGNAELKRLQKHIEILEKEASATKATSSAQDVAKKELAAQKKKLQEVKSGIDKSKGSLLKLATKGYRVGKHAVKWIGKL